MTQTMQAWRVHGFGEPTDEFVLDEVPVPTPGDLDNLGMDLSGWVPIQAGGVPFADLVILDMKAAALALPDVTMARGSYPVEVRRPYISGQEGVGIVIEASSGREHLLGTRVAAVCIRPFGSLAAVSVGISSIFPVPEAFSDEDAAGFVIAGHTAYHAAVRRGGVAAGETVIVTGAAAGARVLAVVGGPEKADFCRSIGAEPIDRLREDVVTRALTDGAGAELIVDPVQGEMGTRIRGALAPDGRHVLCGHAGGLLPLDPHFYLSNHTLVGATLGSYPRPQT
jgi:NADPH2:quinone reductase